MAKVIGKVSATEKCPSTIDEFFFLDGQEADFEPIRRGESKPRIGFHHIRSD